ncbi:MAG: GNAT family N-acetyltransferase [Anaerorhabdus sp.]
MIRKFKDTDINEIMDIWLDLNIKAHNFIDKNYWISKYDDVKKAIANAEVYVYDDGEIKGFVGLVDSYIAGIFAKQNSKGIGSKLLNEVFNKYDHVSLSVFEKNDRAVKFYLNKGFVIDKCRIDNDTGAMTLDMVYKRNGLMLKEYKSSDCSEIIRLFYNSVHNVCAKDYSKELLDLWATGLEDEKIWDESLSKNYTVVAVKDDVIVGFADLTKDGYINRLYTHYKYQRQKIATNILKLLELNNTNSKYTYASITARGFFLKNGYIEEKENVVLKEGVKLKNYLMRK